MKPSIFKLLLWLLVCTVPLQGFASVSMFACASKHGGMHGRAAIVLPADYQQLQADAPAHHAQHCDHHDDENDDASNNVTKADKCSACSACCSLVAIVMGTPVVLLPALAPLPTPSSYLVHVAYVAGGLERPPRPTLSLA